MTKQNKAKVLIIYTGGTIGMRRDEKGTLVPFDFSTIADEFPSIRHLNINIDVYKMAPIDSSNVSIEMWIALANVIKEKYHDYDGFVVLHGTDTMSYSASALSYMLENLCKPVVFTGSQIPMGILRTDGRENLITALEIASARRDGKPVVPEVCLYFQNKLFRGNRSSKQSSEALSAFESSNYPPLAEVGVNIVFNRDIIRYPKNWSSKDFIVEDLKISTSMSPDVVIIKLFPGLTEKILNYELSIPGLKGVVLETFGTGNAPTSDWFLSSISNAIKKGITFINVTQCQGGHVAMDLYETGKKLQKAGVICGFDMTTEAAITKLMWLLGQNITSKKLANSLNTPIRGEFSPKS